MPAHRHEAHMPNTIDEVRRQYLMEFRQQRRVAYEKLAELRWQKARFGIDLAADF